MFDGIFKQVVGKDLEHVPVSLNLGQDVQIGWKSKANLLLIKVELALKHIGEVLQSFLQNGFGDCYWVWFKVLTLGLEMINLRLC